MAYGRYLDQFCVCFFEMSYLSMENYLFYSFNFSFYQHCFIFAESS